MTIALPHCQTIDCTAVALYRAHWPTGDRTFCLPCTLRALTVADVMGFILVVDPLIPSVEADPRQLSLDLCSGGADRPDS